MSAGNRVVGAGARAAAASALRPRTAAIALLLAAVAALAGCGEDTPPAPTVANVVSAYAEHDYVIPFGTFDRIAGGETIVILPNELRARRRGDPHPQRRSPRAHAWPVLRRARGDAHPDVHRGPARSSASARWTRAGR